MPVPMRVSGVVVLMAMGVIAMILVVEGAIHAFHSTRIGEVRAAAERLSGQFDTPFAGMH